MKKIDPNSQRVEFAGIAAKPTEERAKALEGRKPEELLEIGSKLLRENLCADAAVFFEGMLTPEASDQMFVAGLGNLDSALDMIGNEEERFAKMSEKLDAALEARPDSWRVKMTVANLLGKFPSVCRLVDGGVVYGGNRYDASALSCSERLFVRRLRLFEEALPLVRQESSNDGVWYFYESFFNLFLPRSANNYWRLQKLTKTDVLPDLEPNNQALRQNRFGGAPVDAEGNPVFFETPESYETARNDGERVWALQEEMLRRDPPEDRRVYLFVELARFAQELFGVQTLSSYRFFFNNDANSPAESAADGIWSLHTLKDSETIAKLASGVKRFELPPNYDYIELWRNVAELDKKGAFRDEALRAIATEYQNRRQMDKAAEVWKQLAETAAAPTNGDSAKRAYSQIVDPRVKFDSSCSVVGVDATLNVRFRNATGGKFVVKRLNVAPVLEQIRSKKFWQKYGGDRLAEALNDAIFSEANPTLAEKAGRRFAALFGVETKIIGETVETKTLEFDSDPLHFDRVDRVELSTREPGAYLLEVSADNGNTDYAIIWLRDVAIVRKPFEDGTRYFALNASSGEPIPNQKIEFFAVSTRWNGKTNENVVETRSFEKTTDSDGSVLVEPIDVSNNGSAQILAVVPKSGGSKTEASQFSFLDFENFTRIDPDRGRYPDNPRAFFMSDRPIYRPGQKAEFSFVVGNPQYDAPEKSVWAGKEAEYRISSPNGEEVAKKRVKLDDYGVFNDAFELPTDAKLGVYNVELARQFHADGRTDQFLGNGSFRLEEYRKPEFIVTVDAPKDPIALGDKFKAKINAKYYFDAPVTKATVSYKVQRTNHYSTYWPARYWDWFYGCGYWQFAYDCEWYPGWTRWGCKRLAPPFGFGGMGGGFYPGPFGGSGVPEVVLEGETEIGEDGTCEIEIDSSLAKLIFPNDDQEYSITAEVTDASRRTIVGNGKVYAAREPFKTYVWFDRGFYRIGDKMNLGFQARRVDGKSVAGNAEIKLFKIAYEATDDESVKPIETEVYSTSAKLDESGCGEVALSAKEPGQYRVSCVVASENGIEEEGGQLIVVRGTNPKPSDKAEFRFNSLEIIPDKPEYSVGDVAHIQIASNNPDAFVLFAARPKGAVLPGKPNFVKLENGTACVDVKIEVADQPNIFVQAATVFGGRLFQEQRELAVPPEKRVLDVALEPSAERVKPGAKATIKARLTDVDGKPVVGRTVVTVYDKSLDQVAGWSNVGDVREFFWKWRRYANILSGDNLSSATFYDAFHLIKPDDYQTRMQSIDALGDAIGAAYGGIEFFADGLPGARGGARKSMALRRSGRAEAMEIAEEEAVALDDADMVLAAPAAPAPEAKSEFAAGAMGGAMNVMTLAAKPSNAFDDAKFAGDEAEESESAPLVEAVVRKNLADVAYWAADLQPDDDGVIEIEVDMPENLTTWRIRAWSVGDGLRVGSGEAELVTSKDVIVRTVKPRFLTQKDEVVLSANVHNYLESEKKVQVSIEFPKDDPEKSSATLALLAGSEPVREVVVPASGEARVDWTVRAETPGVSTFVMKALTDEESDAIQETISVKEHGIDKQIAVSGQIPKPDEDAENASETVRESTFTMTIPEERRPETTRLTVRFSPTLAGAILDALPYLMEYPYGCAEQTLNKFLPLVRAQRALMESGVDLAKLQEKRVNLNAQELGDAQTRAKQWNRRALENPVFDVERARAFAAAGIEKLQSTQNPDGGWGWFYGPGATSSKTITPLVAQGLQIALQCDQQVDPGTLQRATSLMLEWERDSVVKLIRGKVWTDEQKRENRWNEWKEKADSTDAAIYFALSSLGIQPSEFGDFVDYDKAALKTSDPAQVHSTMKELIWEARTELSLYSLSLYGLALTDEPVRGDATKAKIEGVLAVLSQYRKVDEENQTVWLDLERYSGWLFWSWYGGEFETQARYLQLLVRADRETLEKLGLADDAPRFVKYLLNNRKNATYWRSTRDTALCVEAFSEYLQKTRELAPNETVEVLLDGKVEKTVEFTPDNLFEADGTLELSPEELASGDREITLRVKGDGPLYYNAYLQFFTLEDPIEKAGLELKTERRYYKLVEKKDATTTVEGGRGQAVDMKVERYERVPLNSGDEVTSGDLIEVELLVDSKNDYESILLEDAKPAGYEPTEELSGYNGNALGAYVEYRDDRVCFFADRVPQGRSVVTYRLRAETPGKFSALPTKIWAMYAPELKGNADEFKTKVLDR